MAPKRRNQDCEAGPSNPAKVARLTRSSARAGTAEVTTAEVTIPEAYKNEPGLMEFLRTEAEMVRKAEKINRFGRLPEPNRRYVSSSKPNQNPKPLHPYGMAARNGESTFWYSDAPYWDNTRVAALPAKQAFLFTAAGIATEGPPARLPWLDAPNREVYQEETEMEAADPAAPGNGTAEQTTGAPHQDHQTNEAAE